MLKYHDINSEICIRQLFVFGAGYASWSGGLGMLSSWLGDGWSAKSAGRFTKAPNNLPNVEVDI